MTASAKKQKRGVTFYRKILSYFISIEVVGLLIFGCALTYFMMNNRADEQKKVLLDYTVNIAESYENLLGQEDVSYSTLCYSLLSFSNALNADIFITNTSGSVVFCGEMAEDDDADGSAEVCETHKNLQIPGEIYTGILADDTMATISDFGGVLDEDSFVSATVVKNDGEDYGIVFAVQSLKTGLRPYMIKFLQVYILSAITLITITGLIIYVSSYNMTKPLREMLEATKRYAKGDFTYRIEWDKDTVPVREFYELSIALNSMADDLEKLETSRSNFVANVSHELKTPMTTIGGFIDGILDGTIDDEHQTEYLTIVSDEVKRLSRLVVSMLNMSKMEAGELRLNLVKFDITQIILGVFISFEQQIEKKRINIKGLEYLVSIFIEGDKDMISQVFYNLIDNAVKFTQDGGEISVKMTSDSEYVTTCIRNTGKGIADEDINHIFERFYKGDKSRSLDAKSSGLGLYIVKNLTEIHNGEISVDSVIDKYTEFMVKLKIKLMGM